MAPVVLEDLCSLEEFVGRKLAVTGWLWLTQNRIEQFAEATEDRRGAKSAPCCPSNFF
jgi:acyl dehydratase